MVNQEWGEVGREGTGRGEGERDGDSCGKYFRYPNGYGGCWVRPRGGDGVSGGDVPLWQLGRRVR